MNPWTVILSLGEPEERLSLVAFIGLLLVLGTARSAGSASTQSALAVAILLSVPLLSLRLGERTGTLFLLVASVGSWLVFRPFFRGEPAGAPVVLLNRLAYFAVPPLILGMVLDEKDRERLKFGLAHLYGPAVVMSVGSVIHLALRRDVGFDVGEREIHWAAGIYGVCYLILLFVGLLVRVRAPEERPKPPGLDRGQQLEEEGRYALAARAYEREGQVEKGAAAAERAGDWPRAAKLYRRAGDDFKAAEMYYRAQMLPEALDCYEAARAYPAAARLCLQLGQLDRAVSLYEQGGDRPAAIQALEQAGRKPDAELYRRAGMLDKAAQVFEESGDFVRAAEIYEHELENPGRAAELHVKGSSFLQAGRLFESLGKRQEALEAYSATPAGAVDAARLQLAFGQTQQAAEQLSHLSPTEVEKLDDEPTLTMVARVMVETGRDDEAVRVLQGLKRKGAAGGLVRLLLGRAFLNKGLTDLAEEELRVATSMPLEPADETQAAYLLGCVLETAQQHAEALQIFHGILQKDFGYADVEQRYRRLKPLVSSAHAKPEPTE